MAITEGNMDVASGRTDPVISVRESMRCRHCGTRLQHSLVDLGMSPLCESFLTQDQLDAPENFTVDRNPYKHGRYTPGMHIPIHSVEAMPSRLHHPCPSVEPQG